MKKNYELKRKEEKKQDQKEGNSKGTNANFDLFLVFFSLSFLFFYSLTFSLPLYPLSFFLYLQLRYLFISLFLFLPKRLLSQINVLADEILGFALFIRC